MTNPLETILIGYLLAFCRAVFGLLSASAVADGVLGITLAAIGLMPFSKALRGSIPSGPGERGFGLFLGTFGMALLAVGVIRVAIGY